MKIELTPADAMRLLEYALNAVEFRDAKKVTDIKVNQGTAATYILTLETPLKSNAKQGVLNVERENPNDGR